MVLVDTSVIIDFLRGIHNFKSEIFDKLVHGNSPFAISAFTHMEVLQGARNNPDYERLKAYLDQLEVYYPYDDINTYEKAAKIYTELRRKGKTIRNSIDLLIALTAVDNGFQLLHNDHDFDVITGAMPELVSLDA